jgi:predicted GH43/DUF377 family glycosyl hydrolase
MQFEVVSDVALSVRAREPLASFYQLSPFVWNDGTAFDVLVRGVNHAENPSDKVARVFFGRSPDGLVFDMADVPAIAPGPQAEDLGGCEDPTVVADGGRTYVFYSGWNEREKRGSLMLAEGDDALHLRKGGVVMQSTPGHENPKEASPVQAADGTWRLFFEFGAGGASQIGSATARSIDGPWTIGPVPFDVRSNAWDTYHLSPGPILDVLGSPVMFYNGATRDAKWRIGWVRFDPQCTTVVERSADPLFEPAAPRGDDTDVAFASSALAMGSEIWLYYSVSDQEMRRATLRVVE